MAMLGETYQERGDHHETVDTVAELRQQLAQMRAERDRFERMFITASLDLARVSDRLGLDPNEGGAAPILATLSELEQQRDQLRAALELAREITRPDSALRKQCDDALA